MKEGLNDPLLRMRLSFRVAEILCKSMSTQKADTEKWVPIMNYEFLSCQMWWCSILSMPS